MENKEETKQINNWKIIAIILMLIFLLTLSFFITIKYDEEKNKVAYYKSQMMNFCEISVIQSKIIEESMDKTFERLDLELPILTPCNQWELSY